MFTFAYGQGWGGWPPHGQPDCEISFFYGSPKTLSRLWNIQIVKHSYLVKKVFDHVWRNLVHRDLKAPVSLSSRGKPAHFDSTKISQTYTVGLEDHLGVWNDLGIWNNLGLILSRTLKLSRTLRPSRVGLWDDLGLQDHLHMRRTWRYGSLRRNSRGAPWYNSWSRQLWWCRHVMMMIVKMTRMIMRRRGHLLGDKMLIVQPLSHFFYSTSGDTLNLLLIRKKVSTKNHVLFETMMMTLKKKQVLFETMMMTLKLLMLLATP